MEEVGLNHEAAIGLHAAEADAVSPDLVAAFDIDPIPDGAPLAPLVFASPHSGDIYPSSMIEALRLRPDQLRSSEDSLVDALIAPAPALGACVIRARVARAFVDLNRATFELDPEMYADELPEFARVRTPRGSIRVGDDSSNDSFKYEWISNGVNLRTVFAGGACWTRHDNRERRYGWLK